MRFEDLNKCTGIEFHDRFDQNHSCKDDETPVYYHIDEEDWITICRQDDEDDGLWRGEWLARYESFGDYEGRDTPEEVFEMLRIMVQTYVAEAILDEK